MEDDGVGAMRLHARMSLIVAQIRDHVRQMLNRRNKSFQDVVSTLRVFRDNIDEGELNNADGISQRGILQHLITFLESY
jgi:beta-catenin-like protein 1